MQKPPHLTRAVAGGAQAEKRLSEAQRRSGGGGSRIQKARKEHKFKAVQKDKTAESMSLFLGVPAHLTRAEPSFKQSWSCKGGEFLKETGICVNEQFTTCIFNALSRSHQNPVSPWEKKTLQAFQMQIQSWLLPLQRTPLQSISWVPLQRQISLLSQKTSNRHIWRVRRWRPLCSCVRPWLP